jgi:hypothetical protein
MNCQTYVFKLTSGQLAEAGLLERLDAAGHRWMCRHCRAFTANDALLSACLAHHKADPLLAAPPQADKP